MWHLAWSEGAWGEGDESAVIAASGSSTVDGVGGSIAASAGTAAGTSNATGGSFPPLSIGRAAVKQLSYRNAANPLTGTIVAGEADVTVTAVDASTDQITAPGHGYYDFSGDGPGVWDTASGGTVPGGVTNGASYWFGLVDSSTLKLATSDVNAATSSFVNITSTGSGTHRLLRAQNTQAAQSIIIAAAIRGDWDNAPGSLPPYDNYGNTYTSIDAGPYSYAAWPTAKMGVFASPYNITAGGLDHRLSLDYGPYTPAGAEADEVTVGWVEVLGPAEVIATSYQEVTVPAASFSSASITISRKARIICIVGGSAGLGQQHVFTFSGITGITKIPACSAEAEISANGYCQLSIAHAEVDPAGTPTTYTATIAGTSNEVGKVWLVALAVPQVGTSQGTSTATATGAAISAATGSAAGTASADAGGQSVVAAAGAAAGVGTASGAAASGDGAGAAAGVGTASGAGTAIYSSAGAAAGTSTPAAAGAATAAGTGTSSGTSSDAAVGASTAAGGGAASGTGSPTGTGASTAAADGAGTGTSTPAAVGAATAAGAGAAAGTSSVAATGAAVASAAGAASGTSSPTAAGSATAGGVGAASGTASPGATGAATATAAGAAAGTSSATGSADAGLTVGTAAGVGAATGQGASIFAGAGAAAGSSDAAAAATAIASADGVSSGQAAAAGDSASVSAAAGAAAGTSTGTAAATAIVGAAGLATGVANANAVGRDASAVPPLPRGLQLTRTTAAVPRLTRTTPPIRLTRTTPPARLTRTT